MTVWQDRAATVGLTLALMAGMGAAALALAWGCYRVACWFGVLP
jgi:hypothetical protein